MGPSETIPLIDGRLGLSTWQNIIDFLIRHGYIPQDVPDYPQIIQGLRSPLP